MPSSLEGALVVALLVMPGFITASVYLRFTGAPRVSDAHRLMVSVIFGLWNVLVVWLIGAGTGLTHLLREWATAKDITSVGTALTQAAGEGRTTQAIASLSAVFVLLPLPVFWGVLFSAVMNRRGLLRAAMRYTKVEGSTWDWMMQERLPERIRIRLKNGQFLTGWLAAAALTEWGEDVCLTDVYWWSFADEEWVPSDDTHYFYVRPDDVLYLEYVRSPAEPAAAAPGTPE